MKKLFRTVFLSLILALALFFCACGGGDTPDTDPGTVAESVSEPLANTESETDTETETEAATKPSFGGMGEF